MSNGWKDVTDTYGEWKDVTDTYGKEKSSDKSEYNISPSEATLQAGTQGLTLGFAEEAGAAALTPFEMIRRRIAERTSGTPEEVESRLREQGFTLPDEQPEGIVETYKSLRDPARESIKAGEEQFPTLSLAAEFAGGVLPAVATGGASVGAAAGRTGMKQLMKEGAKAGAKYGAATGLGKSEAELTEGEVGQAAVDVGVGGLTGATLGAALPQLIKVGSKGKGKASAFIQKHVLDPEGTVRDMSPSLDRMISASIRTTKGQKLLGQRMTNEFSKEMDDAIFRLSDDLKGLKKKIGESRDKLLKDNDNPIEIISHLDDNIAMLSDEADNVVDIEAKKEINSLIAKLQSLKSKNVKDIIPGKDTAFQKLAHKRQRMIEDLKYKEKSTLEKQNKNFSDIELDVDNNRWIFRDQTTGKTYQQPIGADKYVTNEIVDGKVKLNSDKLHEISKDFGKAYRDFKSDTGPYLADQQRKAFQEKVKDSLQTQAPEYELLNSRYSLLKTAEDVLKPTFTSANAAERQLANQQLANLADSLADTSNLSTKRAFRQFFDAIRPISPANVGEHQKRIMDIADKIDINLAALGHEATQSTNLRRLVGTVEQLGIQGTIGATKAAMKTKAGYDAVKDLISLPTQQLLEGSAQVSQRFGSQGERLSNILREAANSDITRKNALLFSIIQNPVMKKQLMESFGIAELEPKRDK